jgi:hypothetical protein
MANFDKTLTGELDEIDALFARRNHLTPPLSVARINQTMRQLRQQPLPYRAVWHKQPSRLWGLVAVALAFSFFFISASVANLKPDLITQTVINPFAAEQAIHTPAVNVTPAPPFGSYQTFTIVPVPAFNQNQTGEVLKTVLVKPQTLPPNR